MQTWYVFGYSLAFRFKEQLEGWTEQEEQRDDLVKIDLFAQNRQVISHITPAH